MKKSKMVEILSAVQSEPDLFAQQLYEQYGYTSEQMDELLNDGLVAQPSAPGGGKWNKYHITIKGENALNEALSSEKSTRSEWIRWGVDLAVAIASFIAGYYLGNM